MVESRKQRVARLIKHFDELDESVRDILHDENVPLDIRQSLENLVSRGALIRCKLVILEKLYDQ